MRSIQSKPGVPSPFVDAVVLLAHQGGWDEVLLIGTPILVIAGLLALAKRRIDASTPDDRP